MPAQGPQSTKGSPLNILLAFSAAGEAATGLALLAFPELVVRLLFGAELTGVAIPLARVAGASLTALGVACWPGAGKMQVAGAMLVYSLLITLYLVFLGVQDTWVGRLFWPAVAVHAILTFLLVRAMRSGRR